VITGYNTDVECAGVTYHVQTEDKGLETPVILSLVYSGGAILASKRSPYDDLVASGFDENELADRLQRQHKLICAAVHAGRIEELRKLAAKEAALAKDGNRPRVEENAENSDAPIQSEAQVVSDETPDRFSISPDEQPDTELTVVLSGSQELRGGRSITLRLNVLRRSPNGQERVPDAKVTVKTLGTAFPPQSTFATTDNRGAVAVLISLPDFKEGRAAVLIRAEANGEVAELRKVILPRR